MALAQKQAAVLHLQSSLLSFATAMVLVVGIAGCATSQKSNEVVSRSGTAFGQWSGQGSASRTTKSPDGSEKKENWSFSMEVVSRTPGFGRIEITGAMGVYGGTIIWTPDGTRILLPGQRRFVYAPNSNRAFAAILPVEISPAMIESIAFDRDFDSELLKKAAIKCEYLKSTEELKDKTEYCEGPKGLQFRRTRNVMEGPISFSVTTSDSAVKMQLLAIRSKVQERDELWKLEPPKGFRVQNL